MVKKKINGHFHDNALEPSKESHNSFQYIPKVLAGVAVTLSFKRHEFNSIYRNYNFK